MTTRARGTILWSATLLGVAFVLALVRLRPDVAPDASLSIEPTGAAGADTRTEPDAEARVESPPAATTSSATSSEPRSAALPSSVPQNADDLRVSSPILAPIIESNEQALAAEEKDPAWSTGMEARIVDEISRKALGLEITDVQVDCRTTLCRIDMTFALRLLQKQFAPVSPDIVWDGKQPVMFFAKALDLDFRQQIAMGLNAYGTPVFVGYAFRPPETTRE